ncbi:MAG TPA: hypothetical protein VGR81_10180 [Candidatus Acidoferrales bacterium]|nr:hypothetical protein [Candidatus Acidoferrales bacterium]
MRWFRKWVLHNWSLKLMALLISFLLWATYSAEPVAEIGFAVPIEFVNVPSRMEIANDVPTVVHVRVRGRSALLRRLIPPDLGVVLDLSGRTAGSGMVELDPQEVDAPYGVQIVRIDPQELRIHLVPRENSP